MYFDMYTKKNAMVGHIAMVMMQYARISVHNGS